MADDLSSAPQTGGSEPVADTSAPAAAEAPAKAPSSREAIDKAFATVESRPPTETERAAAVLRDGPGADEKLTQAAQKAAEELAAKDPAASERAKKGWVTRRENATEAEKAEAKTAEAVVDPKAAVKAEPAKVEAPKAVEPSKHQPPARLSVEAKAAWEAAPEPLKADVVRMHDEMTAGLTKYKGDAEAFAELKELHDLAKTHYPTKAFKDVIRNYADIDAALAEDPLGTIENKILKPMGLSLRQVAEHVLKQEPAAPDAVANELRAEIAELKKALGSVTTNITQTKEQEQKRHQEVITSQVESFAKANPRFDELSPHIFKLLKSDLIDRSADLTTQLTQAYETAEKLNPAPSLSPPAPAIPAPDLAAQTRKGQASVSGAPGAGSNPAAKQPVPSSTKAAVDMAFARMGL